MASPERTPARTIPAAVNSSNNNNNHDRELLQSLNKLTLSTSPQPRQNVPLSPAGERRRTSISPSTRAPPRGALTKANLNGMAADTQTTSPALLRKASMNSLRSATSVTPNRTLSRRSSSTNFSSTTARLPSALPPTRGEPVEERPPRTASSVASAYLAKELELLHGNNADHTAETIVILHDDCYGHRYSRPRASKGLLSTIVERPERIQASILGVSMAYVRLGEKDCEQQYSIHPDLDPMTLPGIPFRIHKTARKVAISSTAVTNVHGSKWMEELKIMCDSAEAKLALNGNELRRPEMNRGPDAESPQQLHQGDLYLCAESLNAFEGALGAVCEAVDAVFSVSSHQRAFVAVRPPGHHCSASYPSGFCWVNNVHVGIMHGILNHGLTHAAIIDFDLHHGDGSQAIAWQHNKRGLAKNAAAWKKTSIGYFSVHDINSYPCEYGDEEKVKNASLCIENAHGQSIWNVHLHEWKSDVEFWKLYHSKYSILLEKTRNYLRLQTERFQAAGQIPKAAIFLSAGFDASEWEGAGMQRHKVNVPTGFYARLTRDVVRIASEEGLGVDGRVISVLEGGYSDRALYSGVLSHLSGLAGVESSSAAEGGPFDFKHDSGRLSGSFNRRSTLNPGEFRALRAMEFPYDPNWWSPGELDYFDAAKVAIPPEPKKGRAVANPGNYSSPTQSSSAKMTEAAKVRRSFSNLPASQMLRPRSPTPPPPDVSWATAAHELSKLLIPSHRQVDSCTHSELNTEAAKAKKERQPAHQVVSNVGEVQAAPTRMSLRERKPVSYLEEDDCKSRRRTVAGPTVLSIPKTPGRGGPSTAAPTPTQARRASRRLSAASSLSTATDAQISTATARPESATSMRPTSAMSIRTQSSGAVNARKGRPPGPPKKDAGRAPRAPRKTKPAAVKVKTEPSAVNMPPPPLPLSSPLGEDGSVVPKSQPVAALGDMSSTVSDTPGDLDQITNSLKKIKINVLTKEQKEARQKAKADAASASSTMLTPQDEAFPSNSASSPSERTVIEAHPNPTCFDMGSMQDAISSAETGTTSQQDRTTPTESTIETTPVPMTPTIISPTEPSSSSVFTASSPLVQPPTDDHNHSAYNTEIFIPYQPDGPPPQILPLQRPVQILEPNTGTPGRPSTSHNNAMQQQPKLQSYSVPVSPARRGGHGFTATSSIPFSPNPGPARSMLTAGAPILPQPQARPKVEDDGDELWEIPDTPGRR